MIQIVFKSLDPSEHAREITTERITSVVEKFPELKKSKIRITLEMENSPTKSGPDFFKVKLICSGGKYDQVTLEKSASTLYTALADVVEHLLERLNRFSDRTRIVERRAARISRAFSA